MKVLHELVSDRAEISYLYREKYKLERVMNGILSKKYSNNYSIISKSFTRIVCFDKYGIDFFRLYQLRMEVTVEVNN